MHFLNYTRNIRKILYILKMLFFHVFCYFLLPRPTFLFFRTGDGRASASGSGEIATRRIQMFKSQEPIPGFLFNQQNIWYFFDFFRFCVIFSSNLFPHFYNLVEGFAYFRVQIQILHAKICIYPAGNV